MNALPSGIRQPQALLLPALAVVAAAVGVAIGAEAPWNLLGVALAASLFVAGFMTRLAERVYRPLYVEVPAALLLIASLSLRARDATDLAENPLDAAGLVKLGATLLAMCLALMAILTPRQNVIQAPLAPLPFAMYIVYAAVAFAGIAMSQMPFLTGYRVLNVVAAIVVIMGAVRGAGSEALGRLETIVRRWSMLMLLVGWGAVAIAPGIALEPVDSPIPFRIDVPTLGITANSFGTFGALIVVWYLGELFEKDRPARPRWVSAAGIVLGLASVIGAQYRTGYIALALTVAVLLAVRARLALMAFALSLLVGLSIWGPSVRDEVEPFLLRGQTRQEAAELSGRIEWWTLAAPVWEESPLLGLGLRTASRFLLADAGYDETSSLHSTWVEAIVGTGLLGVTFLVLALLTALARALRWALLPTGRVVPLALLCVLVVRSLTGSSFEDGGFQLLVFLTVAAGLVAGVGRVNPRPTIQGSPHPPSR